MTYSNISKALDNRLPRHQINGILLASILSALMVSGLSGCSASKEEGYEEDQSYEVSAESVASTDASNDSASDTGTAKARLTVDNISGDTEQTLGSQVSDIVIAGKQLVINASAEFKVEDVVKSVASIESLTRQQGGYVALSRISNEERSSQSFSRGNQEVTLSTYERQATMTVRIPREKVTAFMQQVQQQVAFLQQQQFTAEDVTLDIYKRQLEAQLNGQMAKELSEQRLASQNEKQQTSNVNTIAATYSARQQQQYAKLAQMEIADRMRFSTIELKFTQPMSTYKEVTQNLQAVIDAESPSFATRASEAFRGGWEILQSIVIGIIMLWWLWALIALSYLTFKGLKIIYRRFVKAKLRKKQAVRANNKPKSSLVKSSSDSALPPNPPADS